MVIPRGITLAELGSDHFLINEHLDVKSVALAITVIRWLENPDQATSTIPGS
jgi:hypothetical protein